MKYCSILWVWLLLTQGLAASGAPAACADTVALRSMLARPKLPDTARVRVLHTLCYSLHNEHPVQALRYGVEAVRHARALPAAQEPPLLLQSLLCLASCYANLSHGPQALVLLSEAEVLAQRLADTDALARTYAAQGSIFHERGDSATAWRHYHQALLLAEQPAVAARTRMKLFGNVGSLLFFRQQYGQALHFDSLALSLARGEQDATSESNYLASLATFQMRAGNLPRAHKLLTQALAISRRQHALRNQANQLSLLAMYYISTSQPAKATATAREALAVARQSGFLERVLDAYNILAEQAADKRNYHQAYEWNKRYQALNDTLNNRQMLQTLAASQASYETRERVHRIQVLTKQNDRQLLRSRLLSSVVALLALMLAVLVQLYLKLQRNRAALATSNAALKKAADELRGVALFKDRLYAIVAHDMRGPVMAFAGVTGLIDSYIEQNNQAELARLPGIVRQAADSLNHLLDNVLNWAASQTGELAYRPKEVSVAELFAECKALYQTTAEAGRQHITVTADQGLHLCADHNMTRTILRNLVGNALKFTSGGGHVHLDAQPDPNDARMVLLNCTDTGIGMDAATVEQLMNGQLAPTSKHLRRHNGLGLGLGLGLCRAFVHRHGGTLMIQSRLGAGTHVSVSLPIAT